MGIDVCTWRCRIGGFSQPLKCKQRLKTLRLKYVSISIRIALFYLLLAQCVEANPGPGPGTGSRGRGKDSGSSQPGSTSTGRGRYSNAAEESRVRTTYIGQAVGNGNRPYRRSERIQSGQSSINQWLDPQQSDTETLAPDSPPPDGSQSIISGACNLNADKANTNVKAGPDWSNILLDIQSKVSRMDANFDDLKQSVSELRNENKQLKRQNEELSNKVESLVQNVKHLESTVESNELKRERMESQSRRNNLKFYGLEEDVGENWDTTEMKVRHHISNTLQISSDKLNIERAHRLPSKRQGEPRPVIVKFSFFKEKESVLKAYREARKSRTDHEQGGSNKERGAGNVRISEDFPERVSKVRSLLFPFLRENIEKDKRAYLRYDKLIIDGVSHVYDENLQCPVAVGR